MKSAANVDVLIVGAGPVGLFAALILARRGVSVEIIDTLPHRSTHSYALALHSQTLGLFEAHGLLNAVIKGARHVSSVEFYHGQDRSGRFDLQTDGATTSSMSIAVTGQDHLEGVLEEALRKEGVRVRWNHRAAEIVQERKRVRVRVDELQEHVVGYAFPHAEGYVRRSRMYNASFVIGADGFNSFVRRGLDICFPEVASPEDYAVFQFETHCPECDTMQIVEKDGLVNVRWPISERSCRWSFQLTADGIPPEDMRRKDANPIQKVDQTGTAALDETRLQELLAERVPWCPARIENIYWNLWVRFERRLAEKFGEGRVWLAGDAAHMNGPVGVQSMNVGLAEACDLAGRVADQLDSGGSFDTFAEYNEDRCAEWSFLLGLSGGLEPTPRANRALVKQCDRLLSWLPASGNDLDLFADALGFKLAGWSSKSVGEDTKCRPSR